MPPDTPTSPRTNAQSSAPAATKDAALGGACGRLAPGGGWQGAPPREICIIMLSAIGDAVHVLPVATAIKRAWPHTRITWVIQPGPLPMVRNHPAIDDFIIFHRRRGLRAWSSFREIMQQMRGRRFDLLIGLQVYLKAGLITALTPARVKLGFDRMRARDGQWLFTNARIPARGQRHVQDQYLEFAEHLGIDPQPMDWGLSLTPEERQMQADFLGRFARPLCAVVVGTSKPRKNWHATGYARVLEAVERDHGLQPVIVGSPSPTERKMADDIIAQADANIINELNDDLRRLIWIIDASALLISPDTGPLHISRALGTPPVSLFGYTNPKRSGPWRAFADLVVDGYARYPGEQYPLAPVYRGGMSRIRAEDVIAKVGLAMQRHVSSQTRTAAAERHS